MTSGFQRQHRLLRVHVVGRGHEDGVKVAPSHQGGQGWFTDGAVFLGQSRGTGAAPDRNQFCVVQAP